MPQYVDVVHLAARPGDHLGVDLAVAPGAGLVVDERQDVADQGQARRRRVELVEVRVAVDTEMVADRRQEAAVGGDDALAPLRPRVPGLRRSGVDGGPHGQPVVALEDRRAVAAAVGPRPRRRRPGPGSRRRRGRGRGGGGRRRGVGASVVGADAVAAASDARRGGAAWHGRRRRRGLVGVPCTRRDRRGEHRGGEHPAVGGPAPISRRFCTSDRPDRGGRCSAERGQRSPSLT